MLKNLVESHIKYQDISWKKNEPHVSCFDSKIIELIDTETIYLRSLTKSNET